VFPIYTNATAFLIFSYTIASVCGILVADTKSEAHIDP